MPLNLSGPISLAGSTTGQSIAVELGLSPTGSINLNQANVRTLAGVPSGAITMPTNFYGKSSTTYYSTAIFVSSSFPYTSQRVTRLNACAASLGNTTIAVSSSVGWVSASPTSCNVGVFYACGYYGSNSVVRVNGSGALVGSATNAGTARAAHAGARAGANLLVWGGGTVVCCCCYGPYISAVNTTTRINGSGALVGSEGSLSGANPACSNASWVAARSSSSNAIFKGVCYAANRYQRVNSCGAKVGSYTTASCAAVFSFAAGAQIGAGECGNGGVTAFYAGFSGGGSPDNRLIRLNSCGILVGSVTTVGTARYRLGGASVGTIGIFYGGFGCVSSSARAARLNVCGALVGLEISPVGNGLVEIGSSASVV